MNKEKIRHLISQMTLEEKAGLCSGADFWSTKGVERLGIPAVSVSDGPHGLRKQSGEADHLGLNESIRAVCFPAGCAVAASFDRELAKTLGETLGEECQAEDISTILGPAMNIKRSPLCGRNFEYYSEDPLLSAELGAAYVKGVQSKNVGTSPKHFMANNQEYHRMTSDSRMDERTMREIYLASFEGMVKQARPWTIMNSYNKLNGTYLCENKEILTDILRKEWGFDGYVMTDWGAMNNRVEALQAGCNLTNFLLTAVIYTAIAVPYSAIQVVRTASQEERGTMGTFRAAAGYVSGMIIAVLTIPLTNILGGDQGAWIKYGFGFGLAALLCLLLCYARSKETNPAAEMKPEEDEEEQIPFGEAVGKLFRNKYWVMVLVLSLCANVTYGIRIHSAFDRGSGGQGGHNDECVFDLPQLRGSNHSRLNDRVCECHVL